VACLVRRYRPERGQRVSELRRRQPARNAPERLLRGLLARAQQADQAGDRVDMTREHSAYRLTEPPDRRPTESLKTPGAGHRRFARRCRRERI